MQHIKSSIRLVSMTFLLLTSMFVNAQDKINIDKGEIKTWFETNWLWVAGGLVLLIVVIALLSRGGRTVRSGSRKTTTVVKDEHGRTQSVTTTEEPIKLS